MTKIPILGQAPSVLRAKNGLDSTTAGGDVGCRFSTRYVAPGKPVPGADKFWEKMLAEQVTQLRLARDLGVTSLVGTGAGSTGILHGESVVEEMKLFTKAGYSLEETVQCATENGAQFFGMENLGALTVGRKATFLITKGTVKQLPRKLSYLVPERKPANSVEFKADDNFNRRNTLSILRIKI